MGQLMKTISRLENPIQEYAWGSRTAIAELLGRPVPSEKPQAELWMGSHPKAPSLVSCNGVTVPLSQWIESDPPAILGRAVAARFANRLPFLFKVLAAAKPLSIQAHPNIQQAGEGFRRENELGILPSDSRRNYRDDNHKPEIICALTDFWALSGFRKIEDIWGQMNKICPSQLGKELSILRNGGIRSFFHALMTMEKQRQRRVITEAAARAKAFSDIDPVSEWVIRLSEEYPEDIGVIAPTFLNLVKLRAGEALFLPAGHLHSYLDGVGIELMANSDNVLRGGLTPKHIDVPELLKVVNFMETKPDILTPTTQVTGEKTYSTPSEEFILSVISVDEATPFTSSRHRNVEILICTEGNTVITDSGNDAGLEMKKGSSVIIPVSVEQYRIQGSGVLYKAAVPL